MAQIIPFPRLRREIQIAEQHADKFLVRLRKQDGDIVTVPLYGWQDAASHVTELLILTNLRAISEDDRIDMITGCCEQ